MIWILVIVIVVIAMAIFDDSPPHKAPDWQLEIWRQQAKQQQDDQILLALKREEELAAYRERYPERFPTQ